MKTGHNRASAGPCREEHSQGSYNHAEHIQERFKMIQRWADRRQAETGLRQTTNGGKQFFII